MNISSRLNFCERELGYTRSELQVWSWGTAELTLAIVSAFFLGRVLHVLWLDMRHVRRMRNSSRGTQFCRCTAHGIKFFSMYTPVLLTAAIGAGGFLIQSILAFIKHVFSCQSELLEQQVLEAPAAYIGMIGMVSFGALMSMYWLRVAEICCEGLRAEPTLGWFMGAAYLIFAVQLLFVAALVPLLALRTIDSSSSTSQTFRHVGSLVFGIIYLPANMLFAVTQRCFARRLQSIRQALMEHTSHEVVARLEEISNIALSASWRCLGIPAWMCVILVPDRSIGVVPAAVACARPHRSNPAIS